MLQLGMALERADMTTRILDVRASDLLADDVADLPPYQTVQWISVLKSLSAFQMYRRHVRTRVTGAGVVRFLLTDTAFPRSLRYCLAHAGQRLARLPEPEPCTRQLDSALAVLEQAEISALTGHRLSEFLDRMQIELNSLNDAIGARYFRPEPAPLESHTAEPSPMRDFYCQYGNTLFFRNTRCLQCDRRVGFAPRRPHDGTGTAGRRPGRFPAPAAFRARSIACATTRRATPSATG